MNDRPIFLVIESFSFVSRSPTVKMATIRAAKGSPRRQEDIKRMKLRESTFKLWMERKEMRVKGITNSEFAEKFLYPNFQDALRDRVHPDGGASTSRFSFDCRYCCIRKPLINVIHFSLHLKHGLKYM